MSLAWATLIIAEPENRTRPGQTSKNFEISFRFDILGGGTMLIQKGQWTAVDMTTQNATRETEQIEKSDTKIVRLDTKKDSVRG